MSNRTEHRAVATPALAAPLVVTARILGTCIAGPGYAGSAVLPRRAQAPAMLATSAHAMPSRVRTCSADLALDQRSNRSKIASRRAASPAAARWLKFSGAARVVV